MGLVKYKQKRDFSESPEPTGGKAKGSQLIFVVQKHDASHLHYDFRLEMEGVLKSWAVPKGPSLDTDIKRLAMMVEDHPFDYRNFEGIIPGGYGAGTVIVWDQGSYEPVDAAGMDKKAMDKFMRKQLHAGKMHFILKGKKLKGEFALFKTHGRGENAWLLMKIKDKYAATTDILLKNKSVISNKTLEKIEATSTNFYANKRVKESRKTAKEERPDAAVTKPEKSQVKKPAAKKASAKKDRKAVSVKNTLTTASTKKTTKKKDERDVDAILAGTRSLKFPSTLRPMLATLVDKPVAHGAWVYEVKWDGYRAIAFINKGEVELKSRNDKSFNEKFYPVYEAISNWKVNAIVDGEVVAVDDEGHSDFGSLQNWRSEADGQLLYYVFDMLWYEGRDLRSLSFSERRSILRSMLPANDNVIRLSEGFEGSGTEFFEAVKQMGLEGMIAKKADSPYEAGERSRNWLKIKANKRQEMVIGGFTLNDDSRKPFSSLLVGVYDAGELVYTGKVGTGFSLQTQREMLEQFQPYIAKKSPFTSSPDINKPSRFRPDPPHAEATWLKPVLVCEVSFTEMTTDGIMRHPSFEGMRIDKKAKDVIREKAQPTEALVKKSDKRGAAHKTPAGSAAKKIVKPAAKAARKTLLNPTDETQVRKVNGHELKFTNLGKRYWPDDEVSKRDMINYYYQVAPYILPYLKNRPQSMNRHPNGIHGESFYYKDVTGKAPEWIETFKYLSPSDNRERQYLVCTDEASLLYMTSLGCIEMNPWSSQANTPDYPDWCIIDLDPDKNSFDQVITAAQVTKGILDDMGVSAYCKTSGSTGIHIYIPLGAKYSYEQSKEFARVVVKLVHKEIPRFTSLERAVAKRNRKMYLDFLQNRSQATIAAPYSLRPRPGATVSMPLHWDEVKKGLKMKDFTIFNAMERIRSEGDIFKPVLGKGINLEKIVASFE